MNQLIEATLERLIADIEKGGLVWKKTWHGGSGGVMPVNAVTRRHYRGVNVLMLWIDAMTKGYPTPEWATYKQWAGAGKQVAKGQKSSIVFVSKDVVRKAKDPGSEDEHYRLWRCAYVFNAAQLTEPPVVEADEKPVTLEERHARCKATVQGTGALVNYDPAFRPSYMPAPDVIHMPTLGMFDSADAYYATLFHELVHWTGHAKRLARGLSQEDKAYAFEELVAEIGAAFLCADHGVEEVPSQNNSAAYLQHWLTAFKDDRTRALVKAASAASKAFDFILQPVQQMEQAA